MKETQADLDSQAAEAVAPAAAGPAQAPAHALASHVGNRAFAALALSRVAGPGRGPRGSAVARLDPAAHVARTRRPTRVPGSTLARYQQGEAGHGGIEQQGLGEAGFTPEQVKSTYFGNWLRDFSQMGEAGKRPPALMLLLNILALGEFGRELTDADLGGYVPSEHMDNPEGGGTVEDPKLDPAPGAVGGTEEALAKLSPDQRAAYERQQAAGLEILAASAKSGLPPYIEQGKMHAREMLGQAVEKGETPEGMQALGNGLHAVEDYFSHSNFTEVCIVTLKDDPSIKPLLDQLQKTTLGHTPGTLTPTQNGSGPAPGVETGEPAPGGRMQIQTGTYAPGANNFVSLVEALETELTNGELRRTFIKGSLRANGTTLAKATEALSGAGFAAKLATAAVNDLMQLVDLACSLFGEDAVMKAFGFTIPSLASLTGPITDSATTQSGIQAQEKGLSGPTHSEIAKDSPDNPLFAVSRALAVFADKEIGTKIKEVWATMPKESKEPAPPNSSSSEPAPASSAQPTPGPGGQGTPQQEAVTVLVDKFVCNPADDPWWEPVIREAAAGAGGGGGT
jgi:hypothetical protein